MIAVLGELDSGHESLQKILPGRTMIRSTFRALLPAHNLKTSMPVRITRWYTSDLIDLSKLTHMPKPMAFKSRLTGINLRDDLAHFGPLHFSFALGAVTIFARSATLITVDQAGFSFQFNRPYYCIPRSSLATISPLRLTFVYQPQFKPLAGAGMYPNHPVKSGID
ncbi:hypothetical protein B0H17DRAFT_1135549 [Mycena rosella]|uniref:Uncharacterized protein n=1 Tax=Mycena rosella TaxID=1033263 RepID=A0AAD7GCY8_MYCRO|nr:hypothetical protein B0H17DRAFT_1135549 [Mycena rosella]